MEWHPGATHEIALAAEPARKQRVSVWKLLLLWAWVKLKVVGPCIMINFWFVMRCPWNGTYADSYLSIFLIIS